MAEKIRRVALLAALAFALGGCGALPVPFGGGSRATPHPTYKVGAPYTVKGVTYYPHVDYAYDQVGMASWYGEGFQGQYTANGEVFDLNQITAAHTTLPLPSIVEVINLQNNRALHVRVNDRGPFVRGRIIDLSRRAAQLLGFEGSGSTTVRVRVLKDESIRAAAMAAHGFISNGEEPTAVATVENAPRPPAPHGFHLASPRYHVEAGSDDANRLRGQMIGSGYRDASNVVD